MEDLTYNNGPKSKIRMVIKIVAAAAVFVVLCSLARMIEPDGGNKSQIGRWYSVVPPVLAIVMAFLTGRVLLSLGTAVAVGALLTKVPDAPLDISLWWDGICTAGKLVLESFWFKDESGRLILKFGELWNDFASDQLEVNSNLMILAFIPPVFVMVQIIIASGGFRGVIKWLLKVIKGHKSAQGATAFLGVLCFIDDYTNAIIVGSMMQPITDRFRVSREKLAFIVDATSAPVAGLAIISTWIAYEVGQFEAVREIVDIQKSGYAMFFDALPFRFYCLLMLLFILVNVISGIDFGPMRRAQRKKLIEDISADEHDAILKEPGKAKNAIIPLVGFLGFHLTGIWINGSRRLALEGIGGSPLDWVYWRDVIGAAENSTTMLARSAVFGVFLATVCWLVFGTFQRRTMLKCIWKGIKRASMPVAILILAWSLNSCSKQLMTGQFLREILVDNINHLYYPVIVFVVASITSFATGTSYGTMAILLPTAIPVAFALDGNTYGLTTMICLGAVLDGAIFGDHCSPISDTTIISSTASSCGLVEHVRTQLPYSLFVAAIAIVAGYLPAAFGIKSSISLLSGLGIIVCVFVVLRKVTGDGTPVLQADDANS